MSKNPSLQWDRVLIFLLLMLVLVSVPIALFIRSNLLAADLSRTVNVHESIERPTDIAKLRSVMENLDISTTVLHVIPDGLLYYNPEEAVDLASVDENHEHLLETVQAYPGEFQFFCSIDPSDEERLAKVEQCFEDGALGVKLYSGYSYARTKAVNDPSLDEFYAAIEEASGLLMLPINTSKYQDELEGLLSSHPDLDVICPHFCLSSKNLDRLDDLLTQHDNLYVDTSFGVLEFTMEGLKTMTDNHDAYLEFFEKHQDRVLFGTDVVVTTYEDKNAGWLEGLYEDQLSMYREKGAFTSAVDENVEYKALGLSRSIQKKILWKNWELLSR